MSDENQTPWIEVGDMIDRYIASRLNSMADTRRIFHDCIEKACKEYAASLTQENERLQGQIQDERHQHAKDYEVLDKEFLAVRRQLAAAHEALLAARLIVSGRIASFDFHGNWSIERKNVLSQIDTVLSKEPVTAKEEPWENESDAKLAAMEVALKATAEELATARREIERLRHAIQTVLRDDESAPGGWGPDVTCQGILREALNPPTTPAT